MALLRAIDAAKPLDEPSGVENLLPMLMMGVRKKRRRV